MRVIAFANAAGFVSAVFYAICVVGLLVARDAYIALINSMFHGVDFTVLVAKEVNIPTAITGFIVTIVSGWVFGYLFAHCYNWCAKRFK